MFLLLDQKCLPRNSPLCVLSLSVMCHHGVCFVWSFCLTGSVVNKFWAQLDGNVLFTESGGNIHIPKVRQRFFSDHKLPVHF